MCHRKYDQSDCIAGIIGGSIGLVVMLAPVVPDRFGWLVGAIMLLPVILVVAFAGWAVLATVLRGLR